MISEDWSNYEWWGQVSDSDRGTKVEREDVT